MKTVSVLCSVMVLLAGELPSISNAQQQPNTAMKASFVDELEDMFPDSEVPDPCVKMFGVDVPRRGIAGVHILLNGLEVGQDLFFSVSTCRMVKADTLWWYRLVDVPVEQNTGLAGRLGNDNPHVIRRAPFRVFDALEPVTSPVQIKTAVTVLRLEIPIAPDDKPGRRDYTITLKCGRQIQNLTYVVNVHKAILPVVGKESFPFTNWFSLANMAGYHRLKLWSEEHWAMIGKYARLMVRGRQNTFLLGLNVIFDKQDGSRYILNPRRLRRLVKVFTDAGMYYIEGGHLAFRTNGEWASKTFSLMEHSGTGPLATSREGNKVLAHVCRQLMEEIEANGWRDRWLQHASDEPIESHAADYRILVGMVRKYMPGIPIIDANMELTMRSIHLYGALDIWCPKPNSYEQFRQAYEEMRALGDSVWFYTCLDPRGAHLNRLLDQERMRPMLIGWFASMYGLDGFLHWGLNQYRFSQQDKNPIDPFQQTIKGNLPPGDTHVVYPGPDGPWSSTRLEAHRLGFEDYDLLKMLKVKNPERAKAIIKKGIRSSSDYIKNPKPYRALRRELLEALEKE